MVALRDPIAAPLVVMRRRLELVDRAIAGAAQPYHAAEQMPLSEAEAYLKQCADATGALAKRALQDAMVELKGNGYTVAGACVLTGSGRPSASLAATLASHTMIHTAEGEFFREALQRACECAGLAVSAIKEKQICGSAETVLNMSWQVLERRLAELGKPLGPPWRRDEKLSAMASWMVLTQRT